MKKNIGNIERVARVFLGIAVLSLAFLGPKSSWALLAIIPIVTGLIGYCPPYALLGIDTRFTKSGRGIGTSAEDPPRCPGLRPGPPARYWK